MLVASEACGCSVKFVFWKAPKGYEDALAPALLSGAAAHGDEIIIKPTEEYRGPEGDGGIICGVVKREILWDHQAKQQPLVYIDKGYLRSRAPYGDRSLPAWWRMCVNATHPTDYLMWKPRSADRAVASGITQPARRARGGDKILLLGSSAKFHLTHRLPDPTAWARDLVGVMRDLSNREIVYRPKPSWKWAEPIEGTEFDHGAKTPVSGVLAGAFVAVTYGSIACVDAMLCGIPVVCLGNAVAAPMSSCAIGEIETPVWADLKNREQWFANLMYCNFRPQEIAGGLAWSILKETIPYAV